MIACLFLFKDTEMTKLHIMYTVDYEGSIDIHHLNNPTLLKGIGYRLEISFIVRKRDDYVKDEYLNWTVNINLDKKPTPEERKYIIESEIIKQFNKKRQYTANDGGTFDYEL